MDWKYGISVFPDGNDLILNSYISGDITYTSPGRYVLLDASNHMNEVGCQLLAQLAFENTTPFTVWMR